MAALSVYLLVLISLITEALGWRCAYYRNLFDQQPEYKECLVGCCGDSYTRHCCSTAGLIVGCCVAGAFLALVSLIVFCCLRKRRKRQEEEYFRARYPRADPHLIQPGYVPPRKGKY